MSSTTAELHPELLIVLSLNACQQMQKETSLCILAEASGRGKSIHYQALLLHFQCSVQTQFLLIIYKLQ